MPTQIGSALIESLATSYTKSQLWEVGFLTNPMVLMTAEISAQNNNSNNNNNTTVYSTSLWGKMLCVPQVILMAYAQNVFCDILQTLVQHKNLKKVIRYRRQKILQSQNVQQILSCSVPSQGRSIGCIMMTNDMSIWECFTPLTILF